MSIKNAVAVIRKYKNMPIIEDEIEGVYNHAVDAILNAIENGYELTKKIIILDGEGE